MIENLCAAYIAVAETILMNTDGDERSGFFDNVDAMIQVVGFLAATAFFIKMNIAFACHYYIVIMQFEIFFQIKRYGKIDIFFKNIINADFARIVPTMAGVDDYCQVVISGRQNCGDKIGVVNIKDTE